MVLKIQRVHQEETDAQDLDEMPARVNKIKKVVSKRTETDHLHDVEDQDTTDQDPRRKVKLTRTGK